MSYPGDWRPGDKRPAIVFFFGGGWANGTLEQFRPQAEYFAKRGMVCARADYRVRSRDGVSPDKCVEDAISAMRWIRANAATLGVDPNRIVSSGGSAGGHLAACAYFTEGLHASTDDLSISPKPNAMVLYNPALDFLSFSRELLDKHGCGMNNETLERLSPTRHLRKDIAPTLIIDGTKDFLYNQIHEFDSKAKAMGAPVEAYYVEDKPHGFFNLSPWLENTTQRVDDFLQAIGFLKSSPKADLPKRDKPFRAVEKGK